MLLVFTRVLALTVVACRGQQQLTCFEPGQCNAVPDTFTSTNSANECLDYCKQDQDCQWFSWFSDTVCISYTSCPSLNSVGGSLRGLMKHHETSVFTGLWRWQHLCVWGEALPTRGSGSMPCPGSV